MAGDAVRGLLQSVGNYRGLSSLGESDLKVLCREIRELIIDVTLKNGGHLGGSLGAVELCVALLRAFNPERDKIVFDVGHQTYAYKILTDRLDRFHTLRTKGGISGFPRRGESRFDAFDVGHSSTSISAALGFAKARDLMGRGHEVVAVIGDGALLNGLAFEALNNISASDTKLTVILNDNKMSINPRVGGMAEHLAKLSVSVPYKKLKQFVKDQCRAMSSDFMEEKLGSLKTKLKSLLLPTNIFEAMEISYWGPFDGHNIIEMEEIFELSKQYPRSLLIHVVTMKGKGCAEAEEKPASFHGVGSGTVIGVEALPKTAPNDWSQAVSELLIYLAEADPRVVVCTAAMAEGARLGPFSKQFPDRFFDVGIAEGHMMTFAAGLAAGGMRPVVCIYSTFLQRAADQLVHDICLQRHPVLVAVDRSGLNGEDGETHQGLLDIAWGKSVPGLVIGAPRDKIDLCFMISGWLERGVPAMIRFPKGKAPDSVARGQSFSGSPALWGAAEILREGADLCLIGVGCAVEIMLEAAEELSRGPRPSGVDFPNPTVVDLRFVAPIDWRAIDRMIESHSLLVVAEDGYLCGGVGEEIAARAAEADCRCRVLTVGVRSAFVAHATRAEQLRDHGLTAYGVAETIDKFWGDRGREYVFGEPGEGGGPVGEYGDGNEEFDAEASG
jgi:1-deoxy-D-xylulose-5-phosphate synthase